MGTHPIFESDFDCLTAWKSVAMEKSNSESKSEDAKSNGEEKVDDLLNTFNMQLKIEQKSADQKVKTVNRFKPYESKGKKRKRKSLSQKDDPVVPEKPPSPIFKNCSVESRSTDFSTEDLPPAYEEEVNVNELCAYLENAELIPRKMSSMAQSIYG